MSASIDEAQLAHIATLARLRVSPERRAALAGELGKILDYMRILEGADPGEAPSDSLDSAPTWRADQVTASLPRAVALASAGQASDEAFVVPKVVG